MELLTSSWLPVPLVIIDHMAFLGHQQHALRGLISERPGLAAALRMKLSVSSPHDLTNMEMDMGSGESILSFLAKNYPSPAAFPALPALTPFVVVMAKARRLNQCVAWMRGPMFDAGVPWPEDVD